MNRITPWAAALALSSACAAESTSDPAVAPEVVGLEAELAANDWNFHYITAALGGSWTRWWRFDASGAFKATTEEWVHRDGVSTYPTTHDTGTFRLDGRTLALDTEAGLERYQVAVVDNAPRLYTADPISVPTEGRALCARAFVKEGDEWVERHERPGLVSETRVAISGEAVCTFTVTLSVEVDGVAGKETLTPPCARITDPETGWSVVGHLEKHLYRYDHLSEAGLFERHPQPVADALYAAFVMVLATHPDHAGLALHPISSEESLGWYTKAQQPPPE